MIRRPPRSTQSRSSAASDVYKRQVKVNLYLVFAPLVGLLAIAIAIHLMRDLLRKSEGTAKMIEISDAIKTGAYAYLARQFFVAGLFVTGITAALVMFLATP